QTLVEIRKNGFFGGGRCSVGAVSYVLQIREFAFELGRVVSEILGGLAVDLNEFFLDSGNFLPQPGGSRNDWIWRITGIVLRSCRRAEAPFQGLQLAA